jgi:hypothetical protein
MQMKLLSSMFHQELTLDVQVLTGCVDNAQTGKFNCVKSEEAAAIK